MKKIIIVILGLFLFSCNNNNSKTKDLVDIKSNQSTLENFNQRIKWYDFEKGIEKAKKENKHIFIDFYTDWCHWCKVLDEKTYSDEKVIDILNKYYISIKLNPKKNKNVVFKEKKYSNAELARFFKVRGYPALYFLNSNADVINAIPGFLPADKFFNVADYIRRDLFKKNISYETFLKKK